ncbi:MAG: hypothetical protein ACI9SF_000078 [Candidatus Nanohaloarchaea archaeon]|jgi:hypothetical protein
MASDIIGLVFVLGILVAAFASLWKAFEKAGVDGWKAIIPIYNLYLVLKIAGVTPWILLAFFIPILSPVFIFYAYYKFAESFDRSFLIRVLTGIFPFIGLPIIAFGDAVYEGDYQPE